MTISTKEEFIDLIEKTAADRAVKLFGAPETSEEELLEEAQKIVLDGFAQSAGFADLVETVHQRLCFAKRLNDLFHGPASKKDTGNDPTLLWPPK